jgi:ribosomal protein S27E
MMAATGRMPANPAQRGYFVRYRGAETRCPGCSRSQWLVGRIMAECAFCGTALDLPESERGDGMIRHGPGRPA